MSGKRTNKTFSIGLVKEGIVLSLSYQGIEQDRRKGTVFYHLERKNHQAKDSGLASTEPQESQ